MENDNKNLINEDYYLNRPRKIGDFFLGYIGFMAIIFLSYAIVGFIPAILASEKINISSSFFGEILIYLFTTFFTILPIIFFIFANIKTKKTRKYITKGVNFALLTFVLIPVILFGACLIALGNYNGH
jgi:hypothetical protein